MRAMIALCMLTACGAACVQLSPADKEQISKDQTEMGLCATEAHLDKAPDGGSNAKAWATFDSCMARKGFYDGGLALSHEGGTYVR